MGNQLQTGASEAARQMRSLFDEFRNFAFKGNVVDMAVGVIIGAAFGKIIDSLVKNILLPLLAFLTPGNQGYLEWKFVVGTKEIPYGLFVGELVNFLIVALALYAFMVKFLGFLSTQKKKEAPSTEPPAIPEDLKLLREIRDLLAKK